MVALQAVVVALGVASAQASFEVMSLDDAASSCSLTSATVRDLTDNDFTQIICPFGILVAGTTSFDGSLLEYAARVVAELVDGDGDGAADAPAVVDALKYGGSHPAALVCGVSEREEFRGAHISGTTYGFGCQSYSADAYTQRKAIILEEAFHMVHQNGWAEVWPEIFGYADDFSSTVCKEMARLQCAWSASFLNGRFLLKNVLLRRLAGLQALRERLPRRRHRAVAGRPRADAAPRHV